jgi:hypothetical protein
MALKNRDTKTNYIRCVDGKFYLSTDKEKAHPYDELEGIITDIGVKIDTFEGTPIKKIYVIMESEGEMYNVSFNIESSYASSFMTFIKNADLTKPLSLIPIMKEEEKGGKQVKRLSILIKQGDGFMKSFYTKDNPNGLPQMKEMKLNGKTVWEKSDMIAFYEDVVTTELKPKVKGNVGVVAKPVVEKVSGNETEVVDTDTSDDLPF